MYSMHTFGAAPTGYKWSCTNKATISKLIGRWQTDRAYAICEWEKFEKIFCDFGKFAFNTCKFNVMFKISYCNVISHKKTIKWFMLFYPSDWNIYMSSIFGFAQIMLTQTNQISFLSKERNQSICTYSIMKLGRLFLHTFQVNYNARQSARVERLSTTHLNENIIRCDWFPKIITCVSLVIYHIRIQCQMRFHCRLKQSTAMLQL